MRTNHDFDIPFVGLRPGIHEYNYVLDSAFYIEKEAKDFENATANVKLSLEKNSGFLRLKFEVGGDAVVTCDRCGNPLKIDLWDDFNMIVKLVDNPDEMNMNEEDPDVYYLSRTESHLHVSDWLYEFSILSIPNQRMCKEEEIGGPQCNKDVLSKLDEMQKIERESNANNLWKGLDKFKNN